MSWSSGNGSRYSSRENYLVGRSNRCEEREETELELAFESIGTNGQLIASQAEHLRRLRAMCHPTVQLAQQEIRNVEEKLLKLFSMQLISKTKLPKNISIPKEVEEQPSIEQWMEVVGMDKVAVKGLLKHISTVEDLLQKNEAFLSILMSRCRIQANQRKKFLLAVGYLKAYTDHQMHGTTANLPPKLYWDSWELYNSSRILHTSTHRSSVSSTEGDGTSEALSNPSSAPIYSPYDGSSSRGSDAFLPSSPPNQLYLQPPPSPGGGNSCLALPSSAGPFQDKRLTPPPTPPILGKGKLAGDKKFPPTPPPCKKNMLQNTIKQGGSQQPTDSHAVSLGRSASHESRLSLRVEGENSPSFDPNPTHLQQHPSGRRGRLQSDSEVCNRPGFYGGMRDGQRNMGSCGDMTDEQRSHNLTPTSPLPTNLSSVYKYQTDYSKCNDMNKNSLTVPKTPRKTIVPGSMVHNVHHRFTMTLKRETCGYCKKKIPFSGLKCKECNFKCHRECKAKIPPSCGLPKAMLEFFITEKIKDFQNSQIGLPKNIHDYQQFDGLSKISTSQPSINYFQSFQNQESSSSSCNSSTPSSPALVVPASPVKRNAFPFTEKVLSGEFDVKQIPEVAIQNNNIIDSSLSHDSDKTMSTTSNSGSTGTDDSERTVAGRLDSQDSTISESDPNDPRCMRQNSVSSVSQSLREWDIPYDELYHGDVIGKGRFGTVYSGNWHGQVAIKELNMDYVNDEKTLEAFKAEVSTFRKTRHENLVLFMGACMKPPRLAIVTSLVKGYTLYQHIHAMKEKFTMTRTIPIARQIVQGMSYLHARGIIHKDVKTKNIFLETNDKVIITDFGLFNVTRLCYNRKGCWLSIPHGWLCYLAPELMRSLKLNPKPEDCLPFTTNSDVFAFGTVWYELLCGEWPHRSLHPEAVIWQVGRGMKPSLAHLQASRNVKDILMSCWSYQPDDRPEFSALLDDFRKLPKKRLDRSPSHPIQLSRSAESVF